MTRATFADSVSLTPKEAERHGIALNKDGQRRTAFEMLSYPNIAIADLAKIWPRFGELDAKIAEQIEIDAKYDVYLSRQAADVAAYRRDESFALPDRFRLRGATRPVERSQTKIANASAAHDRTREQDRRHDAGGADAFGRAREARTKTRLNKRKQGAFDLDADKKRAFLLTPVSRETQRRLELFVDLLLALAEQVQPRGRLDSSSDLVAARRRFAAAPCSCAGRTKVWADLGSGGGFPGIPIACALADRPGVQVHLVESVGKKATFLREAVQGDRRAGEGASGAGGEIWGKLWRTRPRW